MIDKANLAPKRRWFRFSLQTLFIVVAILGTAGYWLARQTAFERARHNYEYSYAAWNAEALAAVEVCKASLRLFEAETAVPFANRKKAADAHLARVEGIRALAYGDLSEWLMGVSDDASLAAAQARKQEVARYCEEAEQMAAAMR